MPQRGSPQSACILSDNASHCHGGAIFNVNGVVNISGSELSNNSAKNDGGAIYAMENTFTNISLSEFDNNTAERYDGGAIYNGG